MGEKKEAASLSTMLGSGQKIKVNGKQYTIKPIKLKYVEEIGNASIIVPYAGDDSIPFGFLNINREETRKCLAKMLPLHIFDDNDKPISFDEILEEWDVEMLEEVLRVWFGVSG